MNTMQKATHSLLEDYFLDLGPTITLYHGTSSGKEEKIRSEGLRVPRGNHREYLFNLAQKVWDEFAPQADPSISPGSRLPSWVEDKLETYYQKRIWGSVPDENKGYIYASYFMEVAETYAIKYAENGSELTAKPYYYIGQYLEREYGFTLPPRFDKAEPIVVVMEVDWEWITVPLYTQGSFKDFLKAKLRDYKRQGMTKADLEQDEFPYKNWRSEVLITQDVPPSRITEIIRV